MLPKVRYRNKEPNTLTAYIPATDAVHQEFDWGSLDWFVSGPLGNSTTLTVGRCTILPGHENPRHVHPNCDEVLHLLSGSIVHSLGDESWTLNPGDTISIAAGMPHNARSVGPGPATMMISFSSANRQFVPEA
jgi:quercetin dioxygenase-like cupin family protein